MNFFIDEPPVGKRIPVRAAQHLSPQYLMFSIAPLFRTYSAPTSANPHQIFHFFLRLREDTIRMIPDTAKPVPR